jgi:preprotein translocase subunit SecG
VQILITILHIVVCIVLILVVLLQAGKGASMGAAFGGSSQTIFGSSGPGTFLGKMTTVVAAIFMLTSLALSYSALHKGSTLMEKGVPQEQQQTVPAPAEKAPVAPSGQQVPPAQQK